MMKYKVNLIIYLFIFFQVNNGCTPRNVLLGKSYYLIDKEKEILEKVSSKVIVQNAEFINKRKEWGCTQPLFLKITQQKEKTDGFKYYLAFFSESGFYENLPTYFWEKQSIYIAIYLENKEVLSKSEIPKNLLETDVNNCSINESSWLILICDDTYKTKVIDIGLVPHNAIKQFQDFSCDAEDNENGQITIEDAIVDTDLMEKIMRSLPINQTNDNMP